MTGIDCLEAMQAAGADVPVGFVASEGSEEMWAKAAAEGALFLIAKPFTAEDFSEVLRSIPG